MATIQQAEFRTEVWRYTYTSGPRAGKIFLHSPQPEWNDEIGCMALRQANGDEVNKAWVCWDKHRFERDDDGSEPPSVIDCHAVLSRNGFAPALDPSFAPPGHLGGPLIPYSRGERVWIEGSLSQRPGDMIPVVSLDSSLAFAVHLKDVCFVPQLRRSDDDGNSYFATCVGPARGFSRSGTYFFSQPYFEWPAGQPHHAELRLDEWDAAATGGPDGWLATLELLDDIEVRRGAFEWQWSILSDIRDAEQQASAASRLPIQQLLPGDEDPDPEGWEPQQLLSGQAVRFVDSIPIRINSHNCCNRSPDCDVTRLRVEVAPGEHLRLQHVPHFHVENTDIERCPAGDIHLHHCVLWDDKRRCVFAGNSTQGHRCCIPLVEVFGREGSEKMLEGSRLRRPDVEATLRVRGWGCVGDLGDVSVPAELTPASDAIYQYRRTLRHLETERESYEYDLFLRPYRAAQVPWAPQHPDMDPPEEIPINYDPVLQGPMNQGPLFQAPALREPGPEESKDKNDDKTEEEMSVMDKLDPTSVTITLPHFAVRPPYLPTLRYPLACENCKAMPPSWQTLNLSLLVEPNTDTRRYEATSEQPRVCQDCGTTQSR